MRPRDVGSTALQSDADRPTHATWYLIRYRSAIMNAAHVLRRARLDAGLSLRGLAALAATSHSTLAAYESGAKIPRVDTMVRICRAAGYAVDVDLVPRMAAEARLRAGDDLEKLLALADAYPFERTGPLDAPVFGRPGGAA